MKNLSKLLKLAFFVLLTMAVISNAQKIKQRPEIYINNDIIEKVKALDYKPTDLISANVEISASGYGGSGTIIKVDKNSTYILTASHVIHENKVTRDADGKLGQELLLSRNITITANNKNYKGLPIKVDNELDLALLKVYKDLKITPVKIAKKEPIFGETVWMISNPSVLKNVVNNGVFSTTYKRKAIVSTAGFYGSSGCMVVNNKGELIGVLSTTILTSINTFFPSITVFNGISRTKDLNEFLKGAF